MFKGLTVRGQLFLFAGVTFLLFVVAMIIAINGMTSTEQRFKAFLSQDQAQLLTFNEMYAQGLQSGQALRNILLDPANRKAYDNLTKAGSDFDAAFEKAKRLTGDDREKSAILEQVGDLLSKQRAVRDAILTAVAANDLEGAKARLNKEETPTWRAMKKILLDSLDANRKEAQATQADMEQAVAKARNKAIGFGVLALVVAVVIALLIVRNLMKQLGGEPHYAAEVASAVARGDLSAEVAVRRGDSESMLYSMKTMRDSLARMMAELQEVVSAAAQGDFSRRVDLADKSGFAKDLGGSVNQLNADLMQQLGGRPAYAAEVARRIAKGDLTVEVEKQAGDERSLLAAMATMRANLARMLDEMRQAHNETARIKTALDNATTKVMIADNDGKIIYMNKEVGEMFHAAEADIRKSMPHFDAGNILGQNIDRFHRHPEHQRELLAGLADTYRTTMVLGGHTFRLAANPVVNEAGERLGTSVEWFDATHEAHIESEVAGIVNAALLGDFSKRIDLADKEGFMKDLGVGFNQLMETSDLALADVARMLEAMARGDLTQTITADYQGTFAKLKDSANTTVANLKQLVEQIKEAVDAITTAAKEIASGNQDLSQRTEQQASSLEETASSMEELTSTVTQNADNARQADQLAASSSDVAVKGGQVVRASVQTMAEISESSKKIADIIGVIDGIAFQTNILALNAAVEAARAGEQGRGFAVVAGEVRNLAQRSANAAKEIKSLITDSVAKVESGTQQVNEAGRTMEEVVTSIKRVTDIMAEISAASLEQSHGIEQVNQAITQMDEVTQQNAALVEEAAAAAESMEEQAEGLSRAVGVFKLEGGTLRDEKATFNFNSARAKHFLWKGRIRDYLDGKAAMSLSQAVSHRDCDLGKWLYSEGVKAFGHLPAMQALLPIHEELHNTIRHVIELKEGGNLDGAETEYMKIGPISQNIIELLYAIERGAQGGVPALPAK